MSKALVINGANFSENKVGTITFTAPIPCDGIVLSQDTAVIEAIGNTVTLNATITPQNTTDVVVWTSSNEDVATVTGGVVTTIGVGVATITVSCGEQIATCRITSKHIIDGIDLKAANGYAILTMSNDYVPLGSSYANGYRTYAQGQNILNGYKAFGIGDSSYPDGLVYPIPLPKGASKIEFTFPIAFTLLAYAFVNATEISSMQSAKLVEGNATQSVTGGTHTIDISDITADSFVFSLKTSQGAGADVVGDVTVIVE